MADEEDVSELISQFRRFSLPRQMRPDPEWDDLYLYQRQYRKENKITAGQLLNKMNLPINLVQYLYSDASRPSNRLGTLG